MTTGRITGQGWTPPTEAERLLHEAGLRGDIEAQLGVLAAEGLYIGQPRHEVDAQPGIVRWRAIKDPVSRRICRPVLTRGMLPPWHPDWVFHRVSLEWAARFDWSGRKQWLGVNLGTPVALYLPTSPHDRGLWSSCHARTAHDATENRLSALRTGPLYGPLAYGLACGAHLAVTNGVPWNEVGTVWHEYEEDRASLRRSWGITDHAGWREQLDALLDFANSPPQPDYALWVREQLRRDRGELPPGDLWRETAAGTLHDRGAPPDAVTEMEQLVRRIMRYEARFRADGLLPEDGWVTTTSAYDYGRAVCLARWGLAARHCAPYEAEQAIVHAGALSKAAYRSWEAFSAGYVLGRVLRFDDEEYGPFYEGALTAHRLLTEHEGSPWRNIPWS